MNESAGEWVELVREWISELAGK
jgi:hypothetical protein